jgi:hypothetical protein
MTLKELEARVAALEQEVGQLRARLPAPEKQRHWWHDDAGRFANDPVIEEIARLGREYRESLRPGRRKKGKKSYKRQTKKRSEARNSGATGSGTPEPVHVAQG